MAVHGKRVMQFLQYIYVRILSSYRALEANTLFYLALYSLNVFAMLPETSSLFQGSLSFFIPIFLISYFDNFIFHDVILFQDRHSLVNALSLLQGIWLENHDEEDLRNVCLFSYSKTISTDNMEIKDNAFSESHFNILVNIPISL